MYRGGNNEELKINLGDKKFQQRNLDGNQSPIASLVTQVSRTPQSTGFSPSTPSDSAPYATPVAGNSMTPMHINTKQGKY